MANEIIINGQRYPVTDKFQAEVLDAHSDLATYAYSQLELLRDALLRISDQRTRYMLPRPSETMAPGGNLTVVERARLDAITHTINVHHGVNFLQGRSHTDFGFDGVDQVHGNRYDKDCGCSLHVVFDHHKRGEDGNVIHPHYPHSSCDKHAHLLTDFKAHHSQVIADNQPTET